MAPYIGNYALVYIWRQSRLLIHDDDDDDYAMVIMVMIMPFTFRERAPLRFKCQERDNQLDTY